MFTVFLDESLSKRWKPSPDDSGKAIEIGVRLLVGAVVTPTGGALEAALNAAGTLLLADALAWDSRPDRPDGKDRRDLFAREGFHFTHDSVNIRESALRIMLQHPVRAHVFYSHMDWASGLGQSDLQSAMYFTLVRTLLQRYAGTQLELVFENSSLMDSLYGKIVQHAVDSLDRETKRKPRQPRASVEARIAYKPNGGLSTVDYCLGVATLGLQELHADGKAGNLAPHESEAVSRLDGHIAHLADFDAATHRRRFDMLREPSWARHITGMNSSSQVEQAFFTLIARGPTGPFTYIKSVHSLAAALGVSSETLNRVYELASDPNAYRLTTAIVKRKPRRFTAPKDALLVNIHRRLLEFLRPLNDALHPSCVAYVPGRKPAEAAAPHSGQAWVQKLDIADFFPSTTRMRVRETFEHLGASGEVASVLAGLTTYDNALPTGAQTSPLLSNLVLADLDYAIAALAQSMGVAYTRYSDDLVFSSSDRFDMTAEVSSALRPLGYQLNEKKALVRRRGQPVRVAGLTIFETDAPRLPKRIKRRLRISLFLLEKGLDAERTAELSDEEVSELAIRAATTRGWVCYCHSVEPLWTENLVGKFPLAEGVVASKSNPRKREEAVIASIKRMKRTTAPQLTQVSQPIGSPPPVDSSGEAR